MPIAGEPISVLIDGLNLAYWRGRPPSLDIPIAVADALRRHGHAVYLVFDASTPHRLPAAQAAAYAALLHSGRAEQTPSGIPADRHLLRLARAQGAAIVSRDRFRDHRRRYRKLVDDPGRLFGGFVHGDTVSIPALGISGPLHNDAEQLCAAASGVDMR